MTKHRDATKVQQFNAVELIRAKRNNRELSVEEIRWLVERYAVGAIPDEQMSAFSMCVYFNGMSREETRALTLAIADSGSRLDLSGLGRPTVDKHSTGGVGDKITLPLMPLVAAFGPAVPQLSGRGLGHTGGTLDKLESTQGWRADLSTDEFIEQLHSVGGVVCAATTDLAPADKRLYALRDVTATVDSLPLMAASIMSKKIAEGTQSLVLDVKHGAGALMTDIADARKLAETMVELGSDAGVQTTAFLTSMEAPLGYAIGNANEVQESIEVLQGGGPSDVIELTLTLAKEMLELAGVRDADPERALSDGRAMDKWREAIRAQGGDPDAPLPTPHETHTVIAERDGVVIGENALAFGMAAWQLGAGRGRKEDDVSHSAGVNLHVKPGDSVQEGQPLYTLMTDDETRLAGVLNALEGAVDIASAGPDRQPLPLISERISIDTIG
ncbi:thymidine phosphorylase [Brevibacterium linens]|uniref:thymidine phosphorylase n=1 Tax=Brevibacterium linens TaxID=1703 RepID=UPI003BF4A61D